MGLKEKIQDVKILVIGDIMIDHYIWGTCDRISPEAPVPIVDVKNEEITLGGAGNVLKNLCSFGVKPDVVSVIGNDDCGKQLRSLLNELRVNTSGVFCDTDRITSKKSRIIVTNHHIVRIDKETKIPISSEAEDFVISFIDKKIDQYNLVLISDYLKGVITEKVAEYAIKACKKQGILSIIDPKGADYSKYRGATIVKPNKKEAVLATGLPINDVGSLTIAAKKLQEFLACDALVITLSEDGIAIYQNDLQIISTKAKEVYDVTGAGDTVLAALGICLASGMSIEDACVFANQAAAIVVSKIGSATTTVEQVREQLHFNS